MVTSNPSPAYVERVVTAFETGSFTLPDGAVVGSGRRGDMPPVWAAILLDREALDPNNDFDTTFGKVREPVVRFAHWARAFDVNEVDTVTEGFVRGSNRSDRLGQRPYYSPSVFNFFRPGYSAAGSNTAAAGLVAPELQITDANTVIGYANFMNRYVSRDAPGQNTPGFVAAYADEIALADDPDALVEHLNLVLMAGAMRNTTRQRLIDAVTSVSINTSSEADETRTRRDRVQAAVLLAVTSPEFLVQQ